MQNVAIQPTWQICHSERSEESGLLHGQRRSFAPLRMTTSHLKPEEPEFRSRMFRGPIARAGWRAVALRSSGSACSFPGKQRVERCCIADQPDVAASGAPGRAGPLPIVRSRDQPATIGICVEVTLWRRITCRSCLACRSTPAEVKSRFGLPGAWEGYGWDTSSGSRSTAHSACPCGNHQPLNRIGKDENAMETVSCQ